MCHTTARTADPQLMTLGFKKRRQLKCTQSYIKYSQSIIEAVTEAKKKKKVQRSTVMK